MSTGSSRRQEQQARTRRDLLAAAAEVFAARGYHGASVSRIAATAGYTIGALYANYASKEALFLALVDEQLETQGADLDGLALEQDPARLRRRHRERVAEVLAALARADSLQTSTAAGRLSELQVWVLTMELLLFSLRERPELRSAIRRRTEPLVDQLAAVIAHWQRLTGESSGRSPRELALGHSWLLEGAALRLVQEPGSVDPEQAAELITALVLGDSTSAGGPAPGRGPES